MTRGFEHVVQLAGAADWQGGILRFMRGVGRDRGVQRRRAVEIAGAVPDEAEEELVVVLSQSPFAAKGVERVGLAIAVGVGCPK